MLRQGALGWFHHQHERHGRLHQPGQLQHCQDIALQDSAPSSLPGDSTLGAVGLRLGCLLVGEHQGLRREQYLA